jgi:signal peptidase II
MTRFASSLKRRLLLLSFVVLVLDQWTKWLVETRLPPHSSREILPGLLHLSHVRNTGVAFGLLPAQGETWATAALVLLSAGALFFVGWYFLRTSEDQKLLLVALALVLGGAVGNLVDRIATGAVTDFVGVYLGSYRWPDFNVADSAISVGLVLMLLDALLHRPPAPATAGER